MDIRSLIESQYAKEAEAFAAHHQFQSLESGLASTQAYDDFVANVCKSHLKSPQVLAFLFALAPPSDAEHLKHNMLEELGLDEEGVSHPGLLLKLAEAAGFDQEARSRLDTLAQEELRRMCCDPLLYGTLREVGLSVLLETTSFEWMLSRTASRIAHFLSRHRQLPNESLIWFYHHSEVDKRHAEEGLDAVVNYIQFYDFDPTDVQSILELTFRENVFVKRYFGELALAQP